MLNGIETKNVPVAYKTNGITIQNLTQDSNVSTTQRMLIGYISNFLLFVLKSNQGNQDSSGHQKDVIQGQRPDMEKIQPQQRT